MRTHVRFVLCIALLSALFATPLTVLAQNEIAGPEASVDDAWLSMSIDPFGRARIFFGVPLRVTNREQLKQSLSQSLSFPVHFNPPVAPAVLDEEEEFDEDVSDEAHANRYWTTITGESPSAFPNTTMKSWCRINFEPLLATFRAENIEHFKIYIVFASPDYAVNIVGAEPLKFPGRTDLSYYTNDIDVRSPSLSAIAFSKGYSAADLLTKLIPLFLFLLVPPTWILVRSLFASKFAERPAELWGKHLRFLHRLFYALWLIWLPLYSLSGVNNLITLTVGDEHRRVLPFLTILSYFVPLMLAMYLCHFASAKIYRYVRVVEWCPRAVVRRAIFLNIFTLTPLFICLLIFDTLRKDPRQAALYGVIGFIAWVILSQKVAKVWGAKLHALTSGELRDRIFELSHKAGVVLKQIYILPEDRAQLSNAFARSDNSVMISSSLVKNLSKREVDGIMAHEIGHLKERHPQKSSAITVAVIIIANALAMMSHRIIGNDLSLDIGFSCALILALAVLFFVSRRNERTADTIGIQLTNDPEAFISGFAKLSRLNLTPLHSGGWGESLETHPRSMQRLADIASANGIGAERLHELIDDSATLTENKYALFTSDEHEGVIFSTEFKRKYRVRTAFTLFGLLVLSPIPFAWLLDATDFSLLTFVTSLVALFFSFGLYQVVRNKIHFWGQASFSRQLRSRLDRRGLAELAHHGILVGLSPAAESRKYEDYPFWDIGLLWLTNEKLYYVGEQTEFALNRKQVRDVSVVDSDVEWLSDRNLYVSWQQASHSQNETLHFVAVGETSLLSARRKIDALHKNIESWLARAEQYPTATTNLASIAGPNFPAITSTPVTTTFRVRPVLRAGMMIGMLAMVVGFAIQLSFVGIAYMTIVAFLCALLDELPKLFRQQVSAPSLRLADNVRLCLNDGPNDTRRID